MKGIILAAGLGTRLYPLTRVTSKQLLPIYDKPMIYYPLCTLMQCGIREVLLISTPWDLCRFQALLKDGSDLGIEISYAVQEEPRGIAEAFLIAESFIEEDNVALILGDNIFYGDRLAPLIRSCSSLKAGAIIFGYQVKEPERYGVVVFNEEKEVIDIVEKPAFSPSKYAVTGLYFYDRNVISIAQSLRPSKRGELEITDVNRAYLERGELKVHLFDSGVAWLDTGTFEALHQASNYVQMVQERQGIKIGAIEEVALKNGWLPSLAQS